MTITAGTITVEGMEIRFLVEGKDSAGSPRSSSSACPQA